MTEPETNAAYHADCEYNGKSMLTDYAESPRFYQGIYVTKTEPKPEPTADMRFGSLVHCCLLEFDKFPDLYLIARECKVRSGKKWDAFLAAAKEQDMECVLLSEVEKAQAMAKSVFQHNIARDFLMHPEARFEESIRWVNEPTGVKCKTKPDFRIDCDEFEWDLVWDIKTARDPTPEEFGKAAYNFKYHWQAAHYLEGAATVSDKPGRFCFMVIGKTNLFDVYLYQTPLKVLSQGDAERAECLADLANSLEHDEWWGRDQGKLQELQWPPWARKRA